LRERESETTHRHGEAAQHGGVDGGGEHGGFDDVVAGDARAAAARPARRSPKLSRR